jgi:protease PrsW
MAGIPLMFYGAVAPAVFLLHYFYARDRYSPEPARFVLKIYLLSFLAVIPAAILELPLGFLFLGPAGGLMVGLIEEGLKFLCIRSLVFRRIEFDEPYDGILYGVTVSLGFATAENLLYVFATGSLGVLIARAVLAIPAHCLWGVIMGSYLGRARFEPDLRRQRTLFFYGFIIPAVLHGFYDFLLVASTEISSILAAGAAAIVVGQWFLSRRLVLEALARSPFRQTSPITLPLTVGATVTAPEPASREIPG